MEIVCEENRILEHKLLGFIQYISSKIIPMIDNYALVIRDGITTAFFESSGPLH